MNLSVPLSEDNISTSARFFASVLRRIQVFRDVTHLGQSPKASRYLGTSSTAHPATHHHTLRVKNL